MSACLAVCTKDEQKDVIRFLWAGVKSAEIHFCSIQDSALPCQTYISGCSRMFVQV